ncbi:hypothetical protein [Sphingobacterium detergens]
MNERDLRYFFFFLILIFQGIILWILFSKSLEIDGDIGVYLNMIGGYREMDNVEPASIAIFKMISLFPEEIHLGLLFGLVFLLSIIESWIVFVNTKGSYIWLIFFSLAIVPFFHAINLRTGFGMFLLFLTFRYTISLLLTPFFHSSFVPLIVGFRFKLSFKQLIILGGMGALIGITLFILVSDKINSYLGYYAPENGITGVTVEILLLLTFALLLKRKYRLVSSILWYRILFTIISIAMISVKVAIISSRFVTMGYLILLIIVMSSERKASEIEFSVLDLLFYFSFTGLILFRVYRTLTMFGFV